MITEKLTRLGEKLNKVAFRVDRKANKLQIKQAVEQLYGVTVQDVNTMTVAAQATSRFTKSGVSHGRKGAYKKAIITLAKGETIDFYREI